MARIQVSFCIHGITQTIICLLASVCMVTLNSGCEKQESADFFVGEARKPMKVNAFRPEKTEDATKTVSYFGKLIPSRSATLGFSIGGEVASIGAARERFNAGSCLLYTSPSPRDRTRSRMPSSA